MHKLAKVAGVLVFLLALALFSKRALNTSLATHCPATDYDCQITEIQGEIDALTPAHNKNKEELAALNKQITSIKGQIAALSAKLDDLEFDIEEREEDLVYAKAIFDEKAQNHYIFIRTYDPISPFLSDSATETFREISLTQLAIDENRKTMEEYAVDLIKLKEDKTTLEQSRISLSSLQVGLNDQAKFLGGEIDKVEDYIATLTSKQQELAAAKAGGFQTSIGDTPPTLEPCSGPPGSSNFCDPGFRPAFAGFSFGAPHRTGMSQYGAYGRSKSGQSAETILSAYYQGASLNKGYSVPGSITVSGYGTVPFEENYLLGIYEVPESWGDNGGFEALKAQAVAARSYALYATNGGSSAICATEACQVYKPQLKSGKWKEAVEATRGWVMVKDGSAAPTFYSSTTGGYTISQWGWSGIKDTSGSWPDTAYEKVSGSPWFYKGWYKSRGGATCGRSHPWLTSTEMADIINAWEVLHNGASGDKSRISPIDTNCWDGNPYSISELASIGGHTSVSNVSVVYGNDGSTISVTFTTNKGTRTIPGWQLSDSEEGAVNLRAPGYIGLKSSLFNIEKL